MSTVAKDVVHGATRLGLEDTMLSKISQTQRTSAVGPAHRRSLEGSGSQTEERWCRGGGGEGSEV